MGKNKKNAFNSNKKRVNNISLVFDDNKRREFLTGFHKRKLQRKKQAQETLEKNLKEERKRLKIEAREQYKKLVVSYRTIPELETLLKEDYDDGDVNVKVEEISTFEIAKQNNWIGANQPKYDSDEIKQDDNEEVEETEGVPGMDLVKKPQEASITTNSVKQFKSEREVKKLLKKEATKKVKKSKVFQQKNKLERQRQMKKSRRLRKNNAKIHEKKNKLKNKHKRRVE